MEKWSEKRHNTRAVQATLVLAFRQPFSARDAQNAGADSKPLSLAGAHPAAHASGRPHDRCDQPSRLSH